MQAETDLEAEFAQAPDALKAETPAPLEVSLSSSLR